jgi:spore coat polysaccharide biosynthesis protein SpsF
MLGVVLQARMGSSRLPGKVLKSIGSKVLLEHIISRLGFLKHKAVLVVATSDTPKDDIVAHFCQKLGVSYFRGSELNVLQRYYDCAQQFKFTQIVRLTADNPFVDICELDRLIDLHAIKIADYTHSFGVLPVGVGAEIFTFAALENSFYNGHAENHREHVNEYIQENTSLFKIEILDVASSKCFPDVRLTVDTEEDYRKACYIVENACNDYVDTEEAIRLCSHFA